MAKGKPVVQPEVRSRGFHQVAADALTGDPYRTTIRVIGTGGTGSHIAWGLVALHEALQSLGHSGLHVTLCDQDTVEPHNIGRQRFNWRSVRQNKAQALVQEINRAHDLEWEAEPFAFEPSWKNGGIGGNIVITAVDNAALRNTFNEGFKPSLEREDLHRLEHLGMRRTYYWLDLGNSKRSGQVILASKELPTIQELYGTLQEEPNQPSCSAAQSLAQQDLFINQMLATIGLDMLWNLFRRRRIDYHGVFVNMETMAMKPLLIKNLKAQR